MMRCRASRCQMSCLQNISNKIIGTLENGFSSLGLKIGRYPWRFIIGCFVGALLTTLGLFAFEEITNSEDLWVPKDAQVVTDIDWIEDNFPATVTREQILAFGSGGDILTPSGLAALLDIYQESLSLSNTDGITLSDVCIKAGSNCIVYGLLELWEYDNATILGLTKQDILSKIKSTSVSPQYQSTVEYSNYLGTVTRNANGDIIAAESALMTWLTDGSDDRKSTTESWESEFIALGRRGHSLLGNVYVFAGKSRQDEAGDAIQGDIQLLSAGYIIVIIFVLMVLGKCNLLEQRAWLTLSGFVCVGLSILVSIGLSSAFQQGYGPLQSVLPFLLLGIGVDDMFVIMGAFNNLSPEEMALDVPERVSKILRHAGVSITVTSFTDFVAFMIGATTIIPGLRSFCIYAGVGIIALYVLQALLFTSCLALDLHRVANKRDGCCCCIVTHGEDYRPNECSQKQLIPFIFKKGLARLVTKLPFKIAVLMVGLALFGLNLYQFTRLEQYLDTNNLIPSDSYAYKFLDTKDNQFPSSGATGYVYCGALDYWSRKNDFENLDSALQSRSFIKNGTTDSWFSALTSWLSHPDTTDPSIIALLDSNKFPSSKTNFENLTYRLTTAEVVRTRSYLKFGPNLEILASRFPFQHTYLEDASAEIDAMDSTRDLVKKAGFSTSECFPYSRLYANWETNRVIREELYRNLGLALICVFVVTLTLIANLYTCLLVLFGVTATLIDVAGSMHMWGLTIDTVTSIILILSIGLAVDYSAHIGHMFMTIKGTRNDRTKETLGEMGPPVFYGGFSTFLAFLLLARSSSYVFATFFKVNFLVVLYGLFHGLVFLPVILSWIGPKPYASAGRICDDGSNDQRDSKTTADAETGEGISNPAFITEEYIGGEKYIDPHGILGSLDHKPYARENSSANSLSSPTSKGSTQASSPPPEYSLQFADNSNMPSVQN